MSGPGQKVWCRVLVDGETVALLRFPLHADSLEGILKAWPGAEITESKVLGECLADMGSELLLDHSEQFTVDVDGNPVRVRLFTRPATGGSVAPHEFRKHGIRPEYCSVCGRHLSLHGEEER